MRERWVALGAAATLVAGLVAAVTVDDDEPVPGWDARALPLVEFVERERGLRFDRAVPIAFLPDAEFEREVTGGDEEQTEKDKQQLEEFAGRLRALGLLGQGVDLDAAYDELVGSSVVGVYLPDEERVVVRGTELTPYVRGTLVHELTHVLQDQRFDLDALDAAAPGGDTTALNALVEGDAVRVEGAYYDSLSEEDQDAYGDEASAGSDEAEDRTDDLPPVLTDGLGFPYVCGPVLLDALLADGGNTAVDRAFRDPPTSEAQVLDPLAYPVDQDPVDVPDPVLPSGATAFGETGPFGQVFLLQVLGTRLPYADSKAAVTGWRGDSSTGYRLGGKVCNAADVRMADDAATARLASAARRWAAPLPGATVTVSGTTVQLRTCDPGSTRQPPLREPSAYDVLAVRAQILHELLSGGGSLRRAACVADAVIADAARDGYRSLTADDLSDATLERVGQVVEDAADTCS